MRLVAWLLFLAVALLPAAVLAEDEPREVEMPAESSRLVAAGWCPVVGSASRENERLKCDVGLGLSLGGWRRLAVVAVVGTSSVGAGIAWVVKDTTGPSIALAVGVAAPYDDRGLYADEVSPALGITLNWRGAR